MTANVRHYREYIAWLQAKHAGNPARSVQDVVPAWQALLHQQAVSAELGLIDGAEADREEAEFHDYYRRMVEAWLAQLRAPCVRAADAATVLRLLRAAYLAHLELKPGSEVVNWCPYRITGDLSITTNRDLMDDRVEGGSKITQTSAQLHVRQLVTSTGDFVDEGSTVDYSGSFQYTPFDGSGPCAELIDRNYFYEYDQFGPFSGPLTSVDMERGDASQVSLSATWGYTAHTSTATLFATAYGCDWSYSEDVENRAENLHVIGQVGPDGLTYSFGSASPADPFTTVDGELTAVELLQ